MLLGHSVITQVYSFFSHVLWPVFVPAAVLVIYLHFAQTSRDKRTPAHADARPAPQHQP